MSRALALGAVIAALSFGALHGSCSSKDAPAVVDAAGTPDAGDTSKAQPDRRDVIRPAKPMAPASPPSRADEPAKTHSSEASVLQRDLESIVKRWKRKAGEISKGKSTGQVKVGVEVRSLDPEDSRAGGAILASIRGEESMRPASNMKLVTTAAALEGLGHEAEFTTRFYGSGAIENGILRGDLIVLAGGDPLYVAAAGGSVSAWLDPIVAHLKSKGIERIEGGVVLDESDFQDPTPAPGWPDSGQHWSDYCALAGGFSANGGCISLVVSAGPSKGAPGKVSAFPRDHGLNPRIDVKTGAKGSKLNIAVEGHRGNLVVRGTIPLGITDWETRFSAGDPVALFSSVLKGALSRGGIVVGSDEVRRSRGAAKDLSHELAVLVSPIEWSLEPINTDSNNAVADQLFLHLGHELGGEGSREGGNEAVRIALKRLGVSTEGYAQVDGSGLSRDNRISPAQLSALLHGTFERDLADGAIDGAWPALRDSLAVGGETGTLSKRMRGPQIRGRVHAKTGFIGGTSALSGAVETASGQEILFSILVEYPRISGLNTNAWKPMQDEICERLVAFGQ